MADSAAAAWTPTSLHSHLAQYCADAVEQCKQYPEMVAVGTYQLDEETRVRHGGFQMLNCTQSESSSAFTVKQCPFVEAPGVLDAKWSGLPLGDEGLSVLASATATGVVELYALNVAAVQGDSDSPALALLATSDRLVDDEDSMALSLDWDNRRADTTKGVFAASGRIAVSSTHSTVHILEASPSGLQEISSWRAHEFFGGMDIQVWITAFNPWDTQIILSGADDSKCKLWDLRMAGTPTWSTSVHQAGVGSAQWSHLREYLFATGSYDGTVALWDDRNKKAPLAQHEQGGGVWRIKWHPSKADTLATAAMRGGLHVLTLAGMESDTGNDSPPGNVSVAVDTLFDGHAALAEQQGVDLLAYGVDWVSTRGTQDDHATADADVGHLVSCSFYDKAVHVWQGVQ